MGWAFKALPPASNTIIEKTMSATNSDQNTCISLKIYTFLLIIKFIKEESIGKLDFQWNMTLLYVCMLQLTVHNLKNKIQNMYSIVL